MDPIKAKIQELVPDVKGICASHDYHHDDCGPCAFSERSITLSVVLRAIRKVFVTVGHDFSLYEKAILGLVGQWSEHDNYDEQSEECKQFIGSLLGI